MDPPCPCTEWKAADVATVALIALAVVLIAHYASTWLRGAKDRFVSQRAQDVAQRSRELFDRTAGGATYSDYKAAVPGAEAVLYSDTRALWRSGALSPERVQRTL
jgi:hypothetical protein